MRTGRVVALVLGALLALPALALLVAGGALGIGQSANRDSGGYLSARPVHVQSETAAVTTGAMNVVIDASTPNALVERLATQVRLTIPASAGPTIFVGIAPTARVDTYLAGVAHDEVTAVDGGTLRYRQAAGASAAARPTDQQFWVTSKAGPGPVQLDWDVTSGRWTVVLMNADGTPGVDANVTMSARSEALLPVALFLLALGVVLAAGAIALITWALWPTRRATGVAGPGGPATPGGHGAPVGRHDQSAPALAGVDGRRPVALRASLDPALSRWLWLVKWLLALPHFVLLALLWPALMVTTFIAGVVILVTGRFPRGIFEFNLGVLRWTWRVAYYASTGGLGTDRYPPFSLGLEPDYPATLDVHYPERLSRPLVLVKWLLALPHLLIVALLVGSTQTNRNDTGLGWYDTPGSAGLLGLLVLIAGVVLLFTGRYPGALFALIVGLNRWVYRVVAYVTLMTDRYPPFRLDQGGAEPEPSRTPRSGRSGQPSRRRAGQPAEHQRCAWGVPMSTPVRRHPAPVPRSAAETSHGAPPLGSHGAPPLGRLARGGRIAAAVVVVLVGGWGVLAGWWTPRGPLTSAQALSAMVISLLVGLAAGYVLRSRWAMLLGPVVFAVVFELVRRDTDGPMVNGPHLSEYGILSMVVGRGFHGLVSIVPLLLGAALGAGLARRLAQRLATGPGERRTRDEHRSLVRQVASFLRRCVVVLTTVALVALAVGLAAPARTAPIKGPDGNVLPGSVSELIRVPVGGHDLSMMIRGTSTKHPVLLFLAGGPGGTELGAMRNHGQDLEKSFVVVTWDQRGTGKSYDQLDPTSSLTLDRAVADTIEVTNYLRERFGQDRIYLLGQSWGSLLGVLAVREQPQLYAAYIGVGQMVDPRETDQVFYRDTLAWARRTGNAGLEERLTASGPPPYADVLDYERALSPEPDVYPYDHSANAEGQGQMGEGIFVEEYSLIEKVHNLAGFLDTFPVLYPQIQNIDLRTDGNALAVPVYLFQGAHEAPGRAVVADQWFAMLEAPRKQRVVAATSGHRPLWEQPREFHQFMTGTVLAQTAPTG